MTNKEKCMLTEHKDLIPNPGLGPFVEGYSNQNILFPNRLLFMLWIPIVGWILFPIFILFYYLGALLETKHFICLYRDGLLWKTRNVFGTEKETTVRYDEVGGIRNPKIRHYKNIYGFSKYNQTEVQLDICDKEGRSLLEQKIAYYNEKEEDDKYNAFGYALIAIMKRWNEMALERFNTELREKGYGTFYSVYKKQRVAVDVGRNFIKTAGNYVEGHFRFAFQNGFLYIYPDETDRNPASKDDFFAINVNNMYDNTIFLMVVAQFFGIK